MINCIVIGFLFFCKTYCLITKISFKFLREYLFSSSWFSNWSVKNHFLFMSKSLHYFVAKFIMCIRYDMSSFKLISQIICHDLQPIPIIYLWIASFPQSPNFATSITKKLKLLTWCIKFLTPLREIEDFIESRKSFESISKFTLFIFLFFGRR
jgi:hypothetical protein